MHSLIDLGWDAFFEEAFARHAAADCEAARVTAVHRDACLVRAPGGEGPAEVTGRFRHECRSPMDFPAVGDWVVVRRQSNESRRIIHAVLPRRSCFSRTVAGRSGEPQVLAANVDLVFLLSSLNQDFDPRRLERYLTLAWDSGARPVVVLTKADLCDSPETWIRQVEAIAAGATVLALSSLSGEGVETLLNQLPPRHTAVLLGSSGVGKSTLINRLLGGERQAVLPVRSKDDKGRHTTTHRELFILPGGGLLIDTPGLRELQLWDGAAGIEETFADIEELAARCKFTDCRHEQEPGCAVQAAIAAGDLDPARLVSRQKLQRELAHFENRHDPRALAEERNRIKAIHRQLRIHPKYRR